MMIETIKFHSSPVPPPPHPLHYQLALTHVIVGWFSKITMATPVNITFDYNRFKANAD